MKWPQDNQEQLINFYGDPGSEVAQQLVRVVPPFRMTYNGKPLSSLSFHRRAAPALERALKTIWDYYGHDQAKIDKLGVSKTAGTYNPRRVRGSATKWSNHAFGAAIDLNAEENGFNVEGNIPIPVICAFKAEGARWGGDYRGRTDPMHFEFCASGEPERTFQQWLDYYASKGKPSAPPATSTPAPVNPSLRTKMLQATMSYEDNPAATGKPLKVTWIGNEPEIAGITKVSHPEAFAKILALIDAGKQDAAKAAVIQYYDEYTAPAMSWSTQPGIQFLGSDMILHRGPTGAAKIVQMAVGVDVDGRVGRETRDALAALKPDDAINRITAARERYEEEVYGRAFREARGQWQGLVNRWNKARTQAKAFQGSNLVAEIIAVGTTVATGTTTAAAVKQDPWTTADLAMAGFSIAVAAVAIFMLIRWVRRR